MPASPWPDPFLYGACYYPEHWHPSRHASDIARMAETGFNLVRLGEGAWAYWEPEEGRYQFDLFDRVIDLCRRHGLKVVMGTPTYAGPAWVARKYPEVLRWNYERVPMQHGSRRHYNYTSPKYLELSDKLCAALAQHYANEKQIIGWQLDNEFNCHMDVSYAPSDTIAFRRWLREKYEALERLNDAWGTRFWSQAYDDWEQVDLPHPTPTWQNPTQLLDETRFISDCVVRFAKRQRDILKRHNPTWVVTHNGLFPNINGRTLVREALDVYCHDHYPLFWKPGEWPGYAAKLQEARSLSFPFGVLEQQSGPGGQMGYLLRTPRPGEMRLWAWQSIAHGANLVSYFRWRTCPYGAEQHWHGLLDPDDRDNRRLAEAKRVGAEVRKLPPEFFTAPVVRAAAVMRDFDNEANDRRINTYTKSGQWEHGRWIAELGRRHVPTDVVWPDSDLDGYRVLIAPHLKIVDEALVSKLTSFVEAGGTLVLGAQAGLKDRNCHLNELTPPGPLAKLAGVEVEDWTTLKEDESEDVIFDEDVKGSSGLPFALDTFVEVLRPKSAETVATWMSEDPLLRDGSAAITRNRVGAGSVIYVGGYAPRAALERLVSWLMAELDLRPVAKAFGEVEMVVRRSESRTFVCLMNHGRVETVVRGLPAGRDLLAETSVGSDGSLTLPAYGVAIIG